MKKIFVLFFVCISLNSFSQAQWKFYVAFEDGIGAKDTLWMVFDTSATFNNVDTSLNEGSILMDHSKFNVWIYNVNFDSTKTEAVPYTNFPFHGLNNIRAFNYQYPILISWDTSLFRSPILPSQINNYINVAILENDYFWSMNNDPMLQAYNMIIDNHAYAPAFNWGSHDQFPMTIHFEYSPLVINENDLENENQKITISPNPAQNFINITCKQLFKKIIIKDIKAIKVKEFQYSRAVTANNFLLNIEDLSTGIYFCFFYFNNESISCQRFFKSN